MALLPDESCSKKHFVLAIWIIGLVLGLSILITSQMTNTKLEELVRVNQQVASNADRIRKAEYDGGRVEERLMYLQKTQQDTQDMVKSILARLDAHANP